MMMKTRILAIVVWLGIGLGVAQAGEISPVTPLGSGVTLSIYQSTGGVFVDVTDTYLPEWAPGAPLQTVYIVVNGSAVTPTLVDANPAITAVNPNPFLSPPTTSHYPGNCMNYGTDTGPDFTFSTTTTGSVTVPTPTGNRTGYPLISNDCGGMAVIQVGTDTFVIPRDTSSPLNGIPDIWETTFCPANSCPTGKEDGDVGVSGAAPGDGIAAFDEYRGFIVSGVHVRTDPRQKDLFAHLVDSQCGGPSLLPTYFPDGTSLFANVSNLISGTQVHILGFTPGVPNYTTSEWVDRFFSYTVTSGFQYKANPTDTTTTTTAPLDDRQINKNAVYPLVDTATGNTIQKGLRVTECRESPPPATIPTLPLGSAGPGTPNGPDNAIIYTQRIVNSMTSLVGASTKSLRYSTFVSGAWQTASSPACPACGSGPGVNANFLILKAIQFYLAMEIGHAVKLTPVFSTTYGYHNAPFTGDNLDQAITTKIDKGSGGFNTFYIPSLYNSTDQSNFRLKN